MKGRKPVPSAVKKLRGTERSDRMMDEPQFPIPGRMPSPPSNLGADGERLWRSLGKLLLDVGLFTTGDEIALEMLCISYDRMCRAEIEIMALGEVLFSDKGNYYQNPWLPVMNKAWDQCKAMMAEFGLTPAERTRVKAIVRNDEANVSLSDQLFNKVKVVEKESEE